MRKIVIDVDENNGVSIDYRNFAGAECLSEGQRLHELLAHQFGVQIKTTSKTPKPELLAASAKVEVQTSVQEQHVDVGTEG